MYRVLLQNLKTNETFEKTFDSPYLKDQFIRKCRYSRKVVVIGVIKEY